MTMQPNHNSTLVPRNDRTLHRARRPVSQAERAVKRLEAPEPGASSALTTQTS